MLVSQELPSDPRVFENLVFDLLQHAGMQNVVWRTPGPDGGRDIECYQRIQDFSGYSSELKWYVECKRYSSSIDWPTVFQKVGYAYNNSADFLLLVTNSNPSPNCENEISKWNSNNSCKIRVWPGYDLIRILRGFPLITEKYGIERGDRGYYYDSFEMFRILMNLSHVSLSSVEFNLDPRRSLISSSSISELIAKRSAERAEIFNGKSDLREDFLLTTAKGKFIHISQWNETALRAIVHYIEFLISSRDIELDQSGSEILIRWEQGKSISKTGSKDLVDIAVFCNFEIEIEDCQICIRRRENVGQ